MKKDRTYFDRVHTWGRISSLSALAVLLCFPLCICIYFDVWPELRPVMKGLLAVVPLFYVTGIIEVVAYAPLLGAGGTYLSFVTGNITNLKLPCGLSAMENANVRPNTEEGEVITTIAVATSAIVTTVIIACGVLLFSPLLPLMTAEGSVFAPAFKQVMPALFGALGAGYFFKHWKISIAPVLAMVIVLCFAGNLSAGNLVIVGVIVSMLGAYLMYRWGWLGKDDEEQSAA